MNYSQKQLLPAQWGSLMHAGQQCPCRQRGLALLVHSLLLQVFVDVDRCPVSCPCAWAPSDERCQTVSRSICLRTNERVEGLSLLVSTACALWRDWYV